MKTGKSVIFAVALALIMQVSGVTVYAGRATEELCEKIEKDYYYKISPDVERKIKRIKKNVKDEETAISEIADCLDEHSTYYTKEYCESIVQQEEKKSIRGFQTTDSAYVKIDTFNMDSGDEFEKFMCSLSGTEKDLYIDLTDCGGGFVSAMLDVAEWLVPPGVVCTSKFKDYKELYKVEHSRYNPDRKVYIIVSGNTASAAEILAGSVYLYKSGVVIGTEQTYGKTTIQELLPLSTGGVLKITVGEYLIGTDFSITENGLKPEVLLKKCN